MSARKELGDGLQVALLKGVACAAELVDGGLHSSSSTGAGFACSTLGLGELLLAVKLLLYALLALLSRLAHELGIILKVFIRCNARIWKRRRCCRWNSEQRQRVAPTAGAAAAAVRRSALAAVRPRLRKHAP
jgi:hypothetical protein